MKSSNRRLAALLVATLFCSPLNCQADTTVSLTKGFVKKFKDKATIATTFNVDKFHDAPNPVGKGSDDGDIHVSGRDSVVLLPMVAEIINGRSEQDTFAFLRQGSPAIAVPMSGVWRLWFEHPGHEDQIQGLPVPPAANTNPDHIFEFHPVTSFGGFDCLDSFTAIRNEKTNPPKEFRGYAATTAFPSYETRPATITKSKTAVMITSNKAAYNYAEFEMQLTGKPKDVGDGYIVFAEVYALGGEDPITESKRRMVFVKGVSLATS